MRLPKTAQQSIPIRRIYRDGIWEVDGKFSRCWRFTDINYAVSDEEDKKDTLIKYCALEKGLPTDAITKISIVNKHLNPLEFQKEMLMPSKKLVGKFSLKSFVTKDMRNYATAKFFLIDAACIEESGFLQRFRCNQIHHSNG